MQIKRLVDVRISDKNIFGGKAANLGFLLSKKFNVPGGVAIGMKDREDYDIKEIKKHLKQDKLYSVRSSSTIEDSEDYSFAGQFETVLGVNYNKLEESIVKVFDSQNNTRVLNYLGETAKSEYFGVVIEEMVEADLSGVIFTVNPVNSDRNQLYIEAIYGLGENIVSGLVNTDKYLMDKFKKEIIDVNSSVKDKKLVIENDNLIDKSIFDEEPSLKYEMCLKVLDMAMAIENAYGKPQDIEFAIKNDEIFILQSRPITTLWPSIDNLPKDDILISFNAVQVMVNPLTPLGSGNLKDLARIKKYFSESFLEEANGYLYSDVDALVSNRFLRKTYIKGTTYIDVEIKDILKNIQLKENSLFKDLSVLLKAVGFVLPKLIKAKFRLGSKNYKKYALDADEFVFNIDKELKEKLERENEYLAKLDIIDKTISELLVNLFDTLMPNIMAGMMGRMEIIKRYGIEVLEVVEKGVEGNLSTEMGLSIEKLSDYMLTHHDNMSTAAEIDDILKEDVEFAEIYDGFIEKFGFRGVAEIDLGSDRYCENKEVFHSLIFSQYKSGLVGNSKKKFQEMKKRALGYQEEDIEKDRLIGAFRSFMSLREHPKHAISKVFWLVKETYLDIGEMFVEEGRLENKKDIFYLYKNEIKESRDSYKDLISSRKKEYERQKTMPFPKVMTADGKCYYKKAVIKDGMIIGTGASSGKHYGEVLVADKIEDVVDAKGKILVTKFTDPGWTPVFNQIEGLITEVGGLMTHGSVVAREYGLPAVVGVSGATDMFKTGDWITIDGSLGTIEQKKKNK
ncbi:MAG: PEP/pyruvate-binding domain-containing protein [Bacillota bacterium]|nr:PEP/pyruvate-binding domain-containing protein [Bacillota bacterium]